MITAIEIDRLKGRDNDDDDDFEYVDPLDIIQDPFLYTRSEVMAALELLCRDSEHHGRISLELLRLLERWGTRCRDVGMLKLVFRYMFSLFRTEDVNLRILLRPVYEGCVQGKCGAWQLGVLGSVVKSSPDERSYLLQTNVMERICQLGCDNPCYLGEISRFVRRFYHCPIDVLIEPVRGLLIVLDDVDRGTGKKMCRAFSAVIRACPGSIVVFATQRNVLWALDKGVVGIAFVKGVLPCPELGDSIAGIVHVLKSMKMTSRLMDLVVALAVTFRDRIDELGIRMMIPTGEPPYKWRGELIAAGLLPGDSE